MAASANQLMEELKRLRRGRGLHAPHLDRLIGPALRELCEIDQTAGAETVRERIRDWVIAATRALPEDLRMVTLTSLGLNPNAQHAFLTDRVKWLAAHLDRDVRTIRRWLDIGLTRLVEAAVASAPTNVPDDESWRVRHFSALLRLDGPTPVSTERRTIVATADGVRVIPWSLSLPRTGENTPANLDVQVLQGAVLLHMERPSARRFLLHLRLPQVLRAGQAHTFSLDVRVPQGQSMRPTYVFWPERRCDRFDLVVRFDPERMPRLVWRVHDVFHRDADEIEPGPDLLTLDSVGEVAVSFIEPRVGRGYGIQWIP